MWATYRFMQSIYIQQHFWVSHISRLESGSSKNRMIFPARCSLVLILLFQSSRGAVGSRKGCLGREIKCLMNKWYLVGIIKRERERASRETGQQWLTLINISRTKSFHSKTQLRFLSSYDWKIKNFIVLEAYECKRYKRRKLLPSYWYD